MNNNLIQVIRGENVTTSFLVAEKFNKEHKNVMRKIESLISDIDNNLTGSKLSALKLFNKSEQLDAHGQMRPMYYMNRDGFTLLAMGFTGREALTWKLKYIQAFNEMEQRLNNPSDPRLDIAELILKAPETKLPYIRELYPEYFGNLPAPGTLEYISDINSAYRYWIDTLNITAEWITDFPTTDIYECYQRFCFNNHLLAMGKKKFYSTLSTDFHLSKRQKADGKRYFLTA